MFDRLVSRHLQSLLKAYTKLVLRDKASYCFRLLHSSSLSRRCWFTALCAESHASGPTRYADCPCCRNTRIPKRIILSQWDRVSIAGTKAFRRRTKNSLAQCPAGGAIDVPTNCWSKVVFKVREPTNLLVTSILRVDFSWITSENSFPPAASTSCFEMKENLWLFFLTLSLIFQRLFRLFSQQWTRSCTCHGLSVPSKSMWKPVHFVVI